MNGDWMLTVLEALAGEIEMLRYRAKNAEEENMKLRSEIRALRENPARIDASELHAHCTTIDMISPEALRHE